MSVPYVKVIYNEGLYVNLMSISSVIKLVKKYLLTYLIYYCHRVLAMTWTFEVIGDLETLELLAKRKNCLYGHLHQQDWVILALWRNSNMNVLISLSSDGDAMSRIARWNGFRVTRGSSSKSGTIGLLKLIRAIKRQNLQQPASLAVDGPRGPFAIPKKGILMLSKVMNSPLILLAAAADRYWEFSKSWSRTQIPKPFSTIRLRYTQVSVDDLKASSNKDWPALSQRISEDLCYFL